MDGGIPAGFHPFVSCDAIFCPTMASEKYVSSFGLDVTGETTGEKFAGVFKCKTRLSHRDALRQDQVRRGLLGNNPDAASPRALSTAEAFSEFAVRLLDSPSWFQNSDGGLELSDDNVIAELYAKIMECAREAAKELTDKGASAKKDLAAEG